MNGTIFARIRVCLDEAKCFVDSGSIEDILLELFQMKEHGFGLIGDRCNDKRMVFVDFVEDGF